MAAGCEQEAPSQWLWHGRHVKLVDGTTVSMPDTNANQAKYPQQTSQEEGLGFPIVRLHQARTADFRRGRHLGKADHVVTWIRPAKPEWMDQETYDRMPESIEVREVLVQVNQAGFRTKSLVVVTSLCDAEEYASEEIAELYRSRWLVELDIRAVKIALDMDVLRCKTPEMVRRELWTLIWRTWPAIASVTVRIAWNPGR